MKCRVCGKPASLSLKAYNTALCGDDFIAFREFLRESRQFPVRVGGVGKLGLQNAPFRFHLGRFAVCPVWCVCIVGVGIDQFDQFHLLSPVVSKHAPRYLMFGSLPLRWGLLLQGGCKLRSIRIK